MCSKWKPQNHRITAGSRQIVFASPWALDDLIIDHAAFPVIETARRCLCGLDRRETQRGMTKRMMMAITSLNSKLRSLQPNAFHLVHRSLLTLVSSDHDLGRPNSLCDLWYLLLGHNEGLSCAHDVGSVVLLLCNLIVFSLAASVNSFHGFFCQYCSPLVWRCTDFLCRCCGPVPICALNIYLPGHRWLVSAA